MTRLQALSRLAVIFPGEEDLIIEYIQEADAGVGNAAAADAFWQAIPPERLENDYRDYRARPPA